MSVTFRTAGMVVRVDSASRAWLSLAREACAGHQVQGVAADVHVVVQTTARRVTGGLRPVTRRAWLRGPTVCLTDACGSGLDLEVTAVDDVLRVTAWPRPEWRHRALGLAAPDRRVLLHRAALLQYPALWWAGVRGLVPLHVSAVTVAGRALVIAGPGGVGKSTLLQTVDPLGDRAVSDNLCVVGDGLVHGLLEPARSESGTGRRMPHGRREAAWAARADSLAPQHVLVLRRGTQPRTLVRPIDPRAAERELTAGTYAAGELRRYWAFAATLALGTGLGPAHPPIQQVAHELAHSTRCSEVVLPARPGARLLDIVGELTGSPTAAPALGSGSRGGGAS